MHNQYNSFMELVAAYNTVELVAVHDTVELDVAAIAKKNFLWLPMTQ